MSNQINWGEIYCNSYWGSESVNQFSINIDSAPTCLSE